MIAFMAIGASLIALIIVTSYISNRFSEREQAVILPNYIVAIAFLLIMFTASLRDVLEV